MTDQIPNYFFAPCGVNCFLCYAHLKTKKPCNGCLGNDENKPDRCRSCKIKECANNKGFSHCFQCPDYPCPNLKRLNKSYLTRYQVDLAENCRIARESGITELMAIHTEEWSCKKCCGVINQHSSVCSECGQGK